MTLVLLTTTREEADAVGSHPRGDEELRVGQASVGRASRNYGVDTGRVRAALHVLRLT
jgi:hypothetical protein